MSGIDESPDGLRGAIERVSEPVTEEAIRDGLSELGFTSGQTVLVHTSLSALGWVCGGAATVISALEKVVGEHGTLVMPTHSAANTDPARWTNPPVPQAWHSVIQGAMPAFDPCRTPSYRMGAVAELFRTQAGVRRSYHPFGSFAALGPNAEIVTQTHALGEAFGDRSPLGSLYDLDASVLLLGVGHGNNTSLHLAEHRANFPTKAYYEESSAILVNGERRWAQYQSLVLDDDDFEALGSAFDASSQVACGLVGGGNIQTDAAA